VAAAWCAVLSAFHLADLDFAVWDDWAFAKGALAFIAGEGIHYQGAASMPQLGQWLWAWPFVKTLGPSFVTLRLSTITLALLALAAYFDLLRRHGARPVAAVVPMIFLGLNPLFFWLTGTFMTDVPALAFSLLALAAYDRALTSGHIAWLGPATAFGLLAAVTRQNAMAVPLAVALLAVSRPPRRWRLAWCLAIAAPVAACLIASWVLSRRPDAIPLSPQFPTIRFALLTIFISTQFLGLSVLPLAVAVPVRSWRRVFAAGALLAATAAYLFIYHDHACFPYLGPLLPDGWKVVGANGPLLIGPRLGIALTAAGCIGAALFVCQLLDFRYVPSTGRAWKPNQLLILFTVTQWLMLFTAPRLYDRYFVVLLPGCLAIAGSMLPFGKRSLCLRLAPTAVILGGISIATTHDWFSWNAAGWALGRRAIAEGIPASDIEGGMEWDGWHSPTPAVRMSKETYDDSLPRRGLGLRFTQHSFPHLTGRFALSISPLHGAKVIGAQSYQRWLPPAFHFFLFEGLPNETFTFAHQPTTAPP
jgi:hypothetical protein